MGTHDEPIGMLRITGRRLIAVISTEATAVQIEVPDSRPLTPQGFTAVNEPVPDRGERQVHFCAAPSSRL